MDISSVDELIFVVSGAKIVAYTFQNMTMFIIDMNMSDPIVGICALRHSVPAPDKHLDFTRDYFELLLTLSETNVMSIIDLGRKEKTNAVAKVEEGSVKEMFRLPTEFVNVEFVVHPRTEFAAICSLELGALFFFEIEEFHFDANTRSEQKKLYY